jgi:hypothetical protein
MHTPLSLHPAAIPRETSSHACGDVVVGKTFTEARVLVMNATVMLWVSCIQEPHKNEEFKVLTAHNGQFSVGMGDLNYLMQQCLDDL